MPKLGNGNGRAQGIDLFNKLLAQKERPVWITIYGPRKGGKTSTALTMSKHFQALGVSPWERIQQVRKGEAAPIHIDDVAFLEVDQDGLGCGVDFGASLEYVFNFQAVLAEGYGADDAIIAASSAMLTGLPDSVHTLVIDTVSTFDQIMLLQSRDRAGDDNQSSYQYQLAGHAAFIGHLLAESNKASVKRDVIFLCHAKAMAEARPGRGEAAQRSAAESKKKQFATYRDKPDVVPAITGQGANPYLNNSSAILSLLTRTVNKVSMPRLFSGGIRGFESGSRFDSILHMESEGNLRNGVEPNLGRIVELYKQRQKKVEK